MSKYDIKEFNEWLKLQTDNRINWVIDSSIKHGTIKKWSFSGINDIHECQPSLVWNLPIVQMWIDIKKLENSKKKSVIEKFNIKDYDVINNTDSGTSATSYYRSKNGDNIAYKTNCNCKREYYQLWKPISNECFSCEEIEELKKKNFDLETKFIKQEIEKEEKIKNLEDNLKSQEEILNKEKNDSSKKDEKIRELETLLNHQLREEELIKNFEKRIVEFESKEHLNEGIRSIIINDIESESEDENLIVDQNSETRSESSCSSYSLVEESN